VPVSIPTGFPAELGRDGWGNYDQATGFEQELLDVLRHMKDHGTRNVVFITTDVHFAEVFRYTPFAQDPGFQVHEVVTGPLNAGLFPNRLYDATLNTESLFFYGPDAPVTSWAQAKPWMNFGLAQVDEHGRLTLSVNKIDGAAVYTLTLDPR
jgi:alkaline phosphatase D